MPWGELVVAAHTVATLFMTGVIWFVQIVHYPLFAAVPAAEFPAYERRHTTRTVWVVAPPMVVEALTALILAVRPPSGVSPLLAWVGLALVVVIWLSTNVWQIPRHRQLSQGFSASAHQRLVLTNWVRTAAWSLRALLVWLIARG